VDALAGKVAVVTGGSRGIGLAIAEMLASAGARVAICGRDEQSLAKAAAWITQTRVGAEVMWVRCDVSRFADARHLHAAVDKQLGVPDVIVNNAGGVVRKTLDELSEEEWDSVVDVSLKGTFNVTRVFLPQMRARRSGRIVNVASISGREGTPRLTAYCAAKHGVVGFTRSASPARSPRRRVSTACRSTRCAPAPSTPRCSRAPASPR
jgi:3-oxoacyl-[acyl-carrier protein] reductase